GALRKRADRPDISARRIDYGYTSALPDAELLRRRAMAIGRRDRAHERLGPLQRGPQTCTGGVDRIRQFLANPFHFPWIAVHEHYRNAPYHLSGTDGNGEMSSLGRQACQIDHYRMGRRFTQGSEATFQELVAGIVDCVAGSS